MQWIAQEAEKRAGHQVGTRVIWEQALNSLASLQLDANNAQRLAAACQRPSDVQLISRLLKASPTDREPTVMRASFLLKVVDESDASLKEWIEALRIVYAWVEKEGRTTTLPKAAGYVSCCVDAMGAGMPFTSLTQAVQDMLDAYGFEG